MGKITDKQINEAVAVEVAPGRTDRVPATKPRRGSQGVVLLGHVNKPLVATVLPQQVGLQAVI